MLKLLGVEVVNVFVFDEQTLCIEQEIVIIHHVSLLLSRFVNHLDTLYVVGDSMEIRILSDYHVVDRRVCIICERDDRLENFGLWKTLFCGVDAEFVDADVDELA